MSDETTISKTRKKRQMHELQDLGAQLLELNSQQLAKMDLPEDLHTAVQEAIRIKKHEARRRQMQYIGRLMRDIDPEPIKAKLAIWHGLSKEHTAFHRKIERLRDDLLDETKSTATLVQLAQNYPRADLTHLRNLVRNAKKESLQNSPLKNYRELFKKLREILQEEEI